MAEFVEVDPDFERAKSLLKMADVHLQRIEELKESDKDFSSLNVVDYYDAVKNLLLGLLLVKGFSVKGEGAHFELINFVSEHYPKILTNEIHIIDNVRKYRNRISYEGYSIDSDYLERNEEKIKKLIEKLKELLEDVIGKN